MRLLEFAFLLTLVTPAVAADDPLGALLAAQGLTYSGSAKFKVLQHSERKGEQRVFTTIIAENGSERLELETQSPIEEPEARRVSSSEYAVLASLYAPRQTPYPGEVSEVIDCAEEDKPAEAEAKFLGRKVKVIQANAGARFSYGICEKSLIAYRSAFFTAYVPSSRRFSIVRIFVPATANARKDFSTALSRLKGFGAAK